MGQIGFYLDSLCNYKQISMGNVSGFKRKGKVANRNYFHVMQN